MRFPRAGRRWQVRGRRPRRIWRSRRDCRGGGLKVFFTVVARPPRQVRPVDVLAFMTAQRMGGDGRLQVAGRGQRRRPTSSRECGGDVRAWAKDQGITVSGRGRIPAGVVEQYEAAIKGR